MREAYYIILDKQSQFRANYPNIVVNVGAIDILQERNLTDIQAEYARLVKAITTIGCNAILTTIPTLQISHHPNEKVLRQMVLLFNRFVADLSDNGYQMIYFPSLKECDYHP